MPIIKILGKHKGFKEKSDRYYYDVEINSINKILSIGTEMNCIILNSNRLI